MPCACGQHKNAAGCAGATAIRAWRAAHPVEQRELAREAGKANALVNRLDVIGRYVHLDREDAIWQAWTDARRVAKYQRYRARRAK